MIIFGPIDHLRWQVIQRTAHSPPPVVGTVGAPTEIRELYGTLGIEQVLWLDIPVNDLLGVQVLQCLDDLVNVVSGPYLIEPPLWSFHELLVYLASSGKLQNQIDFLLIPEEAVESADIFMPEMTLDLDLSAKLVLNFGLDQLLLVKHFQSNNEFGSFLSSEIDVAKLAPAHWLPDFKIINRPFFRVELTSLLWRWQ